VNQPGGKASATAILEVPAPFRRSAPVPSGGACTSTPTVAGIQSGNISSGSSSNTHHRRIVRTGHRPCTRDPSLIETSCGMRDLVVASLRCNELAREPSAGRWVWLVNGALLDRSPRPRQSSAVHNSGGSPAVCDG
jgi:hypothetical protein